MRVFVPIAYQLDMKRNRFLWRRQLRVWRFLDGLGGNDILDLIVALPFLLLGAVATVELALAVLLTPAAVLARSFHLKRCVLLMKETVRVGERQYRETTLALSLPDRKATKRFWQALVSHVRNGGRLGDPVVAQWFSAERGRIASGADPWQPAPQPVASLTQ